MIRKPAALFLGVLIGAAVPAQGDFKYTETSKITGGAMAGMMKFMGALSKQARQATQPTESTTYVKGNRLRRDQAEGRVQIIDLDGRRIINIDSQKQTYSVITFDQMKAGLERAREAARAQATSQPQSGQPANVQITPKVEVTPTGKTATILNLPTSEVQMRLDMEMQSTDPRSQGQSATMWVKSDSWITPNVPGHEELAAFYQKLGKEMDWMPGTVFGANSQMSQGMAELRKNAAALKGFPLLQYVSMGMGAMGQTAAQGGQTQQTQQTQAPPTESQTSTPITSPGGAITKGLGGMLGGFGRKKKQQQEQPAQESSAGGQASGLPAAPPTTQGSLMDVTAQVTTYSSGALDAGLFEIPTGYTQIQADIDSELGRPSKR